MGESQANHNGQCETQEVDSVAPHTQRQTRGHVYFLAKLRKSKTTVFLTINIILFQLYFLNLIYLLFYCCILLLFLEFYILF